MHRGNQKVYGFLWEKQLRCFCQKTTEILKGERETHTKLGLEVWDGMNLEYELKSWSWELISSLRETSEGRFSAIPRIKTEIFSIENSNNGLLCDHRKN